MTSAKTSRPASSAKPGALKPNQKKARGPRRPRTRKEWAIFVAKWGAVSGLVVGALGAATIAILFLVYGSDPNLPRIESLADYKPTQVSRVVTREGELIGEIFDKRRTLVTYEQLPKVVVDAFVSAEDGGFWKHEGIDYVGMMRALFVNVKEGKKKQGASTITQQVVKNLLLTPARTFKRKFQEIILARRLEKALSKEEILTIYANEIFFGNGRYGVQEAARYYFGKDVGELNAGEAAVLAGIPNGPSIYSPKKPENRERAKDRQIYVLQEMADHGYITVEEAQKWINEPIKVVADANPELGRAPEFVELAKSELVRTIGEDELNQAGATVITSVDLKIQEIARSALQANLRAYDERKKYGRPIDHLKPDKIPLELAKLAKRLPDAGPKAAAVYRAVVLEVHDGELVVDLGDYKASIVLGGSDDVRFNPDGKKASERFQKGDVVRVVAGKDSELTPKKTERQVRFAPGPEGAVVVIEPKTRRLLAVVGGYEGRLAGFNRATMAKRQAGSTFKPFVYAAAIDSGDFTAASIINDAPEVYDLWKPENYKKGAFAGPVRLRHALAQSINTVAIRVTHDITPARVAEMAHGLGVQSELPDGLSLALGSGEVTPLELTNAFATFAAEGVYRPVHAVDRIGDNKLEDPEPKQAIRSEVAYIIVDMMRSVISEGTGSRAAKLGMDIAGKTGTSNNARDAWFVGMSSDLVVGVWVGFDDFQRELGSKEGGSTTALPVFVDIMHKIGKRSSKFRRPAAVEEIRVDRKTGLLAAEGATEDVYTEVYLEGTAPTEVAPAPGEVGADDAILDQYGELGEELDVPPVDSELDPATP